MEISPARPDELDAVVRLVDDAYRGESARAGWTHEDDYMDGERTTAEAFRQGLGLIVLEKRLGT